MDRAGQDDLVAGRHRPGQRRPRPVVERQVGAAFRRPPVVAEPDFMQARGPPRLASDIADLQPPFLDAGGRRVLGPGQDLHARFVAFQASAAPSSHRPCFTARRSRCSMCVSPRQERRPAVGTQPGPRPWGRPVLISLSDWRDKADWVGRRGERRGVSPPVRHPVGDRVLHRRADAAPLAKIKRIVLTSACPFYRGSCSARPGRGPPSPRPWAPQSSPTTGWRWSPAGGSSRCPSCRGSGRR